MAGLCKSLGKKMGDTDIANAMLAMDRDGNNQVSFEEFEVWWNINGGKSAVKRGEVSGSIPLRELTVITSVGGAEFSLVGPERTFQLKAETPAEAGSWLEAFKRAVPSIVQDDVRAGDQRLSKKEVKEIIQAAPLPPPPPPQPPAATVQGLNPSGIRQQIEDLYRTHNPAKLADLGTLISNYGEVKLLEIIREKYGVAEASPKSKPQLEGYLSKLSPKVCTRSARAVPAPACSH